MKTDLFVRATRHRLRGITAALGLMGLMLSARPARAVNPGNPVDIELWVQVLPSVSLYADASASPAVATVGAPVIVTLSVSNAGTSPATSVTAALGQVSGSGAATLSGPTPA